MIIGFVVRKLSFQASKIWYNKIMDKKNDIEDISEHKEKPYI